LEGEQEGGGKIEGATRTGGAASKQQEQKQIMS